MINICYFGCNLIQKLNRKRRKYYIVVKGKEIRVSKRISRKIKGAMLEIENF